MDSDVPDSRPSANPDASCINDGCLRAATWLGDFARDFLAFELDDDVTIDNGYAVWAIRYWTDGRESLATVTLPLVDRPPADGFHIVANNHGTTGLSDACALTGTPAGAGLAGLFGARGMIGVASDYPGIGTEGAHPYLVAESEARAALDSLRAARILARFTRTPVSARYALVGLSQGGHATLAAAKEHSLYAPELDVRAFAVTAPATMWEESWRVGIDADGPHLPYYAMVAWAWTQHYGWTGPPIWVSPTEIDTLMESACLWDVGTGVTLFDGVGTEREAVFTPAFLEAFRSGVWGEYNAFEGWFRLNRIGPYTQTAPLRIYQGDADLVVPEASSRLLVESLRAAGQSVEYVVVEGGTHVNVAFGFVSQAELRTEESIAWIQERLDAPEE